MQTYLVCLRAINVGGKNKVPMADLRAALEEAGYLDPQTYIQTGNIIFDADRCEPAKLAALVGSTFGVETSAVVFTADGFHKIIEANPLKDRGDSPNQLVVFLSNDKVTRASFNSFQPDYLVSEKIEMTNGLIYAYYPDGQARSKLTNTRVEREFSITSTARNWKTVEKLRALLEERSAGAD